MASFPAARAAVLLAATVLLVALGAGRGLAQFASGRGAPARMAPSAFPDRDFVVCRIMYERVRGESGGSGWTTDYPDGEINFSTRLSELTRTRISRQHDGRPNHYVVRLTDDELFQCPFTLASDVGTIGLSALEAERLRAYLLKGGFLWVDDFWGTAAWEHWVAEFGKVLPPAEYPIEDVPLDDPIFGSLMVVTHIPQVPNIGFWRRSGGLTTERYEDSLTPRFRAVRDGKGRIMVVMTYNTDIVDSWEREGEDPGYFYQFSPDGYALGINVLIYGMTR